MLVVQLLSTHKIDINKVIERALGPLYYFLSINSRINVAIGPRGMDSKNQINADRFFACAKFPLISASVPKPIKYCWFKVDIVSFKAIVSY